MNQAARLGIEEDGVAQVVPEEAQIVMPEEPHLALASGEILDLDFAHQQRLVEIDRVRAAQDQPERRIAQLDL